MLDYLEDFNFSRSVTIVWCKGDSPQNWYRTAGDAANHTLLVRLSLNSSSVKTSG
jgi:hypothetical protein